MFCVAFMDHYFSSPIFFFLFLCILHVFSRLKPGLVFLLTLRCCQEGFWSRSTCLRVCEVAGVIRDGKFCFKGSFKDFGKVLSYRDVNNVSESFRVSSAIGFSATWSQRCSEIGLAAANRSLVPVSSVWGRLRTLFRVLGLACLSLMVC